MIADTCALGDGSDSLVLLHAMRCPAQARHTLQ
jgi:hypothetical protein